MAQELRPAAIPDTENKSMNYFKCQESLYRLSGIKVNAVGPATAPPASEGTFGSLQRTASGRQHSSCTRRIKATIQLDKAAHPQPGGLRPDEQTLG